MRIALIAPPYLTVPPAGYGGIEQVVGLLADGLVLRGHDVTLFASGGSSTTARLVSPLAQAPGAAALDDDYYALAHAVEAYKAAEDYEVVHDHTPQGAALGATVSPRPVVHTLHGPWSESARRYYASIQSAIHLVAISASQRRANSEVSYAGVVPNGIDVAAHPYVEDKEPYLIFVGRCTPDKGPEVALEVAHRLGLPLVLVLKRAEPHEAGHWEREVAPRVTAADTVLEELPHRDLVDIMARASAMLFPIQWDEPFGLVMAEALACGTPVVTRPLGAAREIVNHGETGFLCDSVDDLVDAIKRVDSLSPARCRAQVESRFSATAMVEGYEAVYRSVSRAVAARRVSHHRAYRWAPRSAEGHHSDGSGEPTHVTREIM